MEFTPRDGQLTSCWSAPRFRVMAIEFVSRQKKNCPSHGPNAYHETSRQSGRCPLSGEFQDPNGCSGGAPNTGANTRHRGGFSSFPFLLRHTGFPRALDPPLSLCAYFWVRALGEFATESYRAGGGKGGGLPACGRLEQVESRAGVDCPMSVTNHTSDEGGPREAPVQWF